jgi:hypothetical protein
MISLLSEDLQTTNSTYPIAKPRILFGIFLIKLVLTNHYYEKN